MNGDLLGVETDATIRGVVNKYENIRGWIGGTIDFIQATDGMGMFIHDEGMLIGLPLNVPASFLALRPLYGPVVICHAETDEEGNTLPPDKRTAQAAATCAAMWRHVVIHAERLGQSLDVVANADTIPPPTVVSLTDSQFDEWLTTGEVPSD